MRRGHRNDRGANGGLAVRRGLENERGGLAADAPSLRPSSRARRRWGRNLECAGEDPFLSGEYAVHWVRGFQTAKEAPFPLQAAACCKHFVANELEAWNGTDRHHVDSYVPQQDLVDSYLPSFQACVEQGKVAGVMCSCAFCARFACAHSARLAVRTAHDCACALHARAPHACAPSARARACSPSPPPADNAVNGVPSCANQWLLGDLLRGAWQFDG